VDFFLSIPRLWPRRAAEELNQLPTQHRGRCAYGRGEIDEERKTTLDMLPVSGMILLPHFTGDEHRVNSSVTVSIARTSQQHGHAPLSAEMISSSSTEDDPVARAPNPPKIAVCGRRAVMATGTLGNRGKPSDSATGLCLLEHGFGFDAAEEGSIGLPEGSSLFAQPVVLGGADNPEARRNRPLNDNGSNTDRGDGNAPPGFRDTKQRRHVLLLSDRVRSKTHVLEMSSSGEVAPAVPGVSGA